MRIDPGSPVPLMAGAAQCEITPPLEVGILMSSVDGQWAPFEGVRTPLVARALVLEFPDSNSERVATRRAVIVSLDLLTLGGPALGGFAAFKARICAAAENAIDPNNLVLACTHSHSARESGGLTDLYLTPAFAEWTSTLVKQIGLAIATAVRAMRPCTFESHTTSVPELGIHRRFKTTQGIMMSHPEPPADIIISRSGPVDNSVNVGVLRDSSQQAVAILVNSTCHPVYEMCCPMISADYPGELTRALERSNPGAIALFLNGAAGNINPQGVSAGPDAARQHGHKLATAVGQLLTKQGIRHDGDISLQRRRITLPTRRPAGVVAGETTTADLVALRIGDAAFLFIPGEPFVEIALAIREASCFDFTAIVGFAEESIGYIPTDQALSEGGYEAAFGGWSYIAPGSEQIIRRESLSLLREIESASAQKEVTVAPHFRDHENRLNKTRIR